MTFRVVGEGYLGSVVRRRWQDFVEWDPVDPEYTVYAIRPDDPLLAETLAEWGSLILPSTDAIHEDTEYARTKRVLERTPGAVIIRAGIVDTRHRLGVAYRNWRCNPLTPLEWADLAWDLRDKPGLHVAGREGLSRYEVERTIAEVYDRPPPVAAWAETPVNRFMPDGGDWPPLRDALIEYREWSRS